MFSQKMRNLVRSFESLGASGGSVTMTSEQFALLADGLGAIAEYVEALEAHVVPAGARHAARDVRGNVIPFSKPWGGNPPGSHRGPGGGNGGGSAA